MYSCTGYQVPQYTPGGPYGHTLHLPTTSLFTNNVTSSLERFGSSVTSAAVAVAHAASVTSESLLQPPDTTRQQQQLSQLQSAAPVTSQAALQSQPFPGDLHNFLRAPAASLMTSPTQSGSGLDYFLPPVAHGSAMATPSGGAAPGIFNSWSSAAAAAAVTNAAFSEASRLFQGNIYQWMTRVGKLQHSLAFEILHGSQGN